MLRRCIVVASCVALCIVGIVGRVNVATYDATNAGVVVTAFGQCVGLEVLGTPGIFTTCD